MEERIQSTRDDNGAGRPRTLASVLRRRILVMVPVAALVLVATVVYAITQPRIYEASTWLLVAPASDPRSAAAAGVRGTEMDMWRMLLGDIAMHTRLLRRREMAEKVSRQLDLDASPGELVANLRAEKVSGLSSNLISISFRSEDPEQAMLVANVWAEAYQEDTRQRSVASTVEAIRYVEEQIATVESDLRQMEEQMAALERSYLDSGIAVAEGTPSLRVAALMEQVAATKVEIEGLEAQVDRTTSQLETEPAEVEEVQEEPSLRAQAIEQQLSALHIELQQKLQDYYSDSPEVQALQEQIQRLEQQLEDQTHMTRSAVTTAPNPTYQRAQDTLIALYGQLDAARARLSALQTEVAQQKVLAGIAPEGAIEYNELMRKVQSLQGVHAALFSQLYELKLKRATAVPPVQVMKEADEVGAPVSPRYERMLAMGLAAAVLLAVFAAVVVDHVDDTFAGADEVREALGQRLIGVLPEILDGDAAALQVGAPDRPSRTPFAEAMRMLGSAVRIEMAHNGFSSLTVTSSDRSEGKTLVAVNLAATLAGAGQRVLLVDADLHRPRIHSIFGIEREPGLTELLLQDAQPQDIIRPTGVEGLSVVTSGPLPPSPVDLLASAQGQRMIEQLDDLADYVIWDTPPAGFLADATVVGHTTDTVLFVIGSRARRSLVRDTLQDLEEVGVRLLGLVVNRIKGRRTRYYYYYEHGE